MIGLGVAVAASWLALVIALLLVRPKGNVLREALRILPDLIRLLKNLGYADDAIIVTAEPDLRS